MRRKPLQLPPKAQAIHLAGYKARFRGCFLGDCPYDGILAAVWSDGWLDANERIANSAKQRGEPDE